MVMMVVSHGDSMAIVAAKGAEKLRHPVCDHGSMAHDRGKGNDWGLAPSPAGASSAFIVPVIASAVLFLVAGLLVNWLIGAAVAVIALAVWVRVIITTGKRILASAGARPPKEGEAERIRNILDGLRGADRVGFWLIDSGDANALVTWTGEPQIAVTTAVSEGFSRTESEAVIAHCLARVRAGEVRTTTFQLGSGLPKPPPVGAPHDVAAVAITRYPPGLVAALGRCSVASGRWAHAWLAGAPPSHTPAAERIAALSDL